MLEKINFRIIGLDKCHSDQINMKILIISLSGIGNTILFTPTLKELRRHFPKSEIDLLVLKERFSECVRGTDLVNEIKVIPENKISLLKFIFSLRKNKYDISITVFPSNKWQFNVLAYLIGAKKRITHSYYVGKFQTMSFLQNCKIKANSNIHDVYQNLNLLSSLGICVSQRKPKLLFQLQEENKNFAAKYLCMNRVYKNDYIIGVHSGAGPIGKKKKWGLDNFANEINKIIKRRKHHFIILFGGIEETKERNMLKNMINSHRVVIFNGSLRNTAALISECDYFISNDTGLMHIASCFGVKQKAVFISTNWIRTSPFSENAKIVKLNKKINFKYPFWSVRV